jgi:hypothetical protein|eukprot:COSAG01_NODE_599_length_15010_cov_103.295755_6_plen_83_part_00
MRASRASRPLNLGQDRVLIARLALPVVVQATKLACLMRIAPAWNGHQHVPAVSCAIAAVFRTKMRKVDAQLAKMDLSAINQA